MAINPATAAAMARTVSTGLNLAAGGATGRGAEAGRCATGAAVVGRGAATGAAAGAVGIEAAPVGPPGGSVGNLIVGAAEGLGGRLIRTVSFLG